MRALTRWQAMVKLFMLATMVYAIATKQSHGTFPRVPFEFRRPTGKRFRDIAGGIQAIAASSHHTRLE